MPLLADALRLIMIKADGSVLVHADAGGYKPLNWMTPPTVIEEAPGAITVRKRAGASEDRLEISITEVLSDVIHEMGSPEQDAGSRRTGSRRICRSCWRRRHSGAERGCDSFVANGRPTSGRST